MMRNLSIFTGFPAQRLRGCLESYPSLNRASWVERWGTHGFSFFDTTCLSPLFRGPSVIYGSYVFAGGYSKGNAPVAC